MKWNDISNFFSASPLGWTHQQFSAVPHTHCPPDLSPPLQLSFRCSPIVICLFWYWGAQTCTQWSRWGCISTAYRGTVPSLNQLVMPWLYLSSLEYLLLSKCSCEHCLVTVMCVFSFNTCTQESTVPWRRVPCQDLHPSVLSLAAELQADGVALCSLPAPASSTQLPGSPAPPWSCTVPFCSTRKQ